MYLVQDTYISNHVVDSPSQNIAVSVAYLRNVRFADRIFQMTSLGLLQYSFS